MKTAALLLVLLLAGCAHGESYRTTARKDDGSTIVCEVKRTGYFFAGKASSLVCGDDALEIK